MLELGIMTGRLQVAVTAADTSCARWLLSTAVNSVAVLLCRSAQQWWHYLSVMYNNPVRVTAVALSLLVHNKNAQWLLPSNSVAREYSTAMPPYVDCYCDD